MQQNNNGRIYSIYLVPPRERKKKKTVESFSMSYSLTRTTKTRKGRMDSIRYLGIFFAHTKRPDTFPYLIRPHTRRNKKKRPSPFQYLVSPTQTTKQKQTNRRIHHRILFAHTRDEKKKTVESIPNRIRPHQQQNTKQTAGAVPKSYSPPCSLPHKMPRALLQKPVSVQNFKKRQRTSKVYTDRSRTLST